MSLLPPQAIQEFQALWKERYGEELPDEEAAARAHQVFTLVKMLVEPPAPPCAAPPSPVSAADPTTGLIEGPTDEPR